MGIGSWRGRRINNVRGTAAKDFPEHAAPTLHGSPQCPTKSGRHPTSWRRGRFSKPEVFLSAPSAEAQSRRLQLIDEAMLEGLSLSRHSRGLLFCRSSMLQHCETSGLNRLLSGARLTSRRLSWPACSRWASPWWATRHRSATWWFWVTERNCATLGYGHPRHSQLAVDPDAE
jgi:hypothetical protein